jgi:4'-phosphopantetheinyl transferase
MAVRLLQCAAADLPAAAYWLAPEERERLAALRFAKRRAEWQLGRYAAKRLLQALLPGSPPLATIIVRAASDGAPEALVRERPAPLVLSLSHSGTRALGAAAPAPLRLGCDIERIEPRSEAFVADYLTSAEQAWVASVSEAEGVRLVNMIWSAKESTLKALRTGLRMDTRRVEVAPGLAAGLDWEPLSIHCGGEPFVGWWRLEGGYVVTVVCDALGEAPRWIEGPARWRTAPLRAGSPDPPPR